MRLDVRSVGPEHNDALLALTSTSSTGSDAFRVDRSPDFFALGRFLGDPELLGLFDEGVLIGCIGLTRSRRYIDGSPTDLVYVHDLRIDPRYRATRAVVTLLEAAVSSRRDAMAYGTVLDGSRHQRSFERCLGRLVGGARSIGHTVHVGTPLFDLPDSAGVGEARSIPASEAVEAYLQFASGRAFAPAALGPFLDAEGEFLGVFLGARMVAVAKVLDQSKVRKIVADGGEEVPIAYLALYAAEDDAAYDLAMVAHVRKTTGLRFHYAFRGMSEAEAGARTFARFAIRLASTTYAFGGWGSSVELDYHELALV